MIAQGFLQRRHSPYCCRPDCAETVSRLEAYVRRGGSLFATGNTSLPGNGNNFQLADLFGCDYHGESRFSTGYLEVEDAIGQNVRRSNDLRAGLFGGVHESAIEPRPVEVPAIAVRIENEVVFVWFFTPPDRNDTRRWQVGIVFKRFPDVEPAEQRPGAWRQRLAEARRVVTGSLEDHDAQPGTGRIVTGTFRHDASDVVDVLINGQPSIGCTAGHRFWSEDRHAFVPANQLRPGEQLRAADGRLTTVESMTARPGQAPVFNYLGSKKKTMLWPEDAKARARATYSLSGPAWLPISMGGLYRKILQLASSRALG
jgi:hypothetical protein